MSEYIRKRTLEEQTQGLGLFAEPATTRGNMGRVRPVLRHDVDTSQEHQQHLERRIKGQARHILDYLILYGAHTRAELSEALSIPIQSVCPAVAALRRECYVIQQETRRNGGHLLVAVPNGPQPERIDTIIPRVMAEIVSRPPRPTEDDAA